VIPAATMNVQPLQPLQANYRIANVSTVASAMMLIACFFDVFTGIGYWTLSALAYLHWRRRWMRVLLFCVSLCNLMSLLVFWDGLSCIFGTVDIVRKYWGAADEPRPNSCYIQRYRACRGFRAPCSMVGKISAGELLCGPVLLFLASSVLILMATTWLSSTNAPRTGKSGGWLFWLLVLTCNLWHPLGDFFSRLLAGAGLLLAHNRSRKLKYAFLILTSVYIANAALEARVAQRSDGITADAALFDLTKTDLGAGAMAYDLWKFFAKGSQEQYHSILCHHTEQMKEQLVALGVREKPSNDIECSDACSNHDNPSYCREVVSSLFEMVEKYANTAFAVGASLIALFYSCT
jgi:hypothetical protein